MRQDIPTRSPFGRINIALAAMMFMQFMLVAVWWPQLSSYLTRLHMDEWGVAIVMSSMAVGSMLSPVVGGLVDRFWRAEWVLCGANLLTAAGLAGAAFATRPLVFAVLILFVMVCHMPTWSLAGSIAMAHADPAVFPRIRLFGSLGWIASGVFGLVATRGAAFLPVGKVAEFDGTQLPLLCGCGVAVGAAALSLCLPTTPPRDARGEKFSLADALGLKAFALLRERSYLVFVVGMALAMMAFVLYFNFGSMFLKARGYALTTLTMNVGQVSELLFLFLTTNIMMRLGIKKAVLLGLFALMARYVLFYLGAGPVGEGVAGVLIIGGIACHGLIFGLLFVGGQVYTAQRAPVALRAQAQGMFAFILWGVAILAGTLLCTRMIEWHSTMVSVEDNFLGVVKKETDWETLFLWATGFSGAILLLFLFFFHEEKTVEGTVE
ncbi:MAG: MFS transporter [Puniceicoccales bacterium]|nr:MFS transporter [Puniceicoccales bacterium]